MPDGSIVIHQGLIDILDNESELIGLIGHEISHYKNRHSVKSIFRETANVLVLSLLVNDMASVTNVIAENIHVFESLSFSRKYESQADNDAFDFVIENNLNPDGIATLFQKLSEQTEVDIPEFMSTHPDAEKRAKAILKKIESKKIDTLIIKNQKLDALFKKLKK